MTAFIFVTLSLHLSFFLHASKESSCAIDIPGDAFLH